MNWRSRPRLRRLKRKTSRGRATQRRLVPLFGQRPAELEFAPRLRMSANFGLISAEQLVAGPLLEPQHQLVLHVAHAVVDAEELQNLGHRLVHVVGQLVEAKSSGEIIPPLQQLRCR